MNLGLRLGNLIIDDTGNILCSCPKTINHETVYIDLFTLFSRGSFNEDDVKRIKTAYKKSLFLKFEEND